MVEAHLSRACVLAAAHVQIRPFAMTVVVIRLCDMWRYFEVKMMTFASLSFVEYFIRICCQKRKSLFISGRLNISGIDVIVLFTIFLRFTRRLRR